MRKLKEGRVNKTGSLTVSLGEHFGNYLNNILAKGRHVNASEILREALREHEDKRKEEDSK